MSFRLEDKTQYEEPATLSMEYQRASDIAMNEELNVSAAEHALNIINNKIPDGGPAYYGTIKVEDRNMLMTTVDLGQLDALDRKQLSEVIQRAQDKSRQNLRSLAERMKAIT